MLDPSGVIQDRQQAKSPEELESQLARLEAVQAMWLAALQEAGIAMWEWSSDQGGTYYFSQQKLSFPAGESQSINQTELSSILPEEVFSSILQDLKSQDVPHPEYRTELNLVDEEGNLHYYELMARLVERTLDGDVHHIIGTLLDITRRKNIELYSQATEERLRHALEASNEGVWDLDFESGVFNCSDRFLEIMDLDDFYPKNVNVLNGLVHPDDYARVLKSGQVFLQSDAMDYHDEFRILTSKGITRWISVRGKAIRRDEKDALLRSIGTISDITYRKELELELRGSEERYRQIVEDQAELICRYLADGTLTFVNDAYCRFYNLPREELVGSKFWQFIHEEDRTWIENELDELTVDQTMHTTIHREVLPGGEIRWVEWTDKLLREQGSSLPEYQAVGRDITEQMLAEKALRESEIRFRLVAENATDMISLHDPQNLAYIYASPSSQDILGYNPEELIGKNPFDYVFEEDSPLAMSYVESLFAEKTIAKLEIRALHRSGKLVWLETMLRIVQHPESGQPLEVLAISRDITERKLADQEERSRSKRAAMLREVDQIILTSESPAEFIQPVLHGIRRYLECDLVFLMGFDRAEQKLVVMHHESNQKDVLLAETLNFNDPHLILRYRTGFIEWINELDDYQDQPEFINEIHQAGMHSVAVAPLVVQGELIGAISLSDRKGSAFGQDQIDFIRQVAVSLAFALRQSFLLDELRTLLAHHEALRQISLELAGELDLDTLLISIVNGATEMADAQSGGLMLYDAERNLFILRVMTGETPLLVGSEYPTGGGLTGAVFDSGEIMFIENYAVWEGRLYKDKDYPPYKMAAIPIALAQEKLGVLILILKEPQVYKSKIEDLLRLFAMQAAIAIKNARLYEAERQARSQLSELNQYLQTAREEERTHIAREIHDEFGQLLTALKMDTAWLAKHLPEKEISAKNKTNDMLVLIDRTINLVRQIATELRPGILDELGLTSAIEWQIQVFVDRHGISCDYELDDIDVDLDDVAATTIFRVFQETLTNIVRHAEATRVVVELIDQENSVILHVKDDGKGTNLQDLDGKHSLGILGMRERVSSVGGKMAIDSKKGQGMEITVNIPKKEPVGRKIGD
jgi:PAS domain S-box-containing protein